MVDGFAVFFVNCSLCFVCVCVLLRAHASRVQACAQSGVQSPSNGWYTEFNFLHGLPCGDSHGTQWPRLSGARMFQCAILHRRSLHVHASDPTDKTGYLLIHGAAHRVFTTSNNVLTSKGVPYLHAHFDSVRATDLVTISCI